MRSRYFLLQVNDALFPIGGYAHSYGLETYVQQEIVKDKDSAWEYLKNSLLYRICYTDLLAIAMAYDYGESGNVEKILELDELLTAIKAPAEIRSASYKLGTRFLKVVQEFEDIMVDECFRNYCGQGGLKHHAVVYGAFCQAAEISREDMLLTFLYAQASAIVTNCVKLVPLSQTVGQKLLYQCYPVFDQVLERLAQLNEEDLGAATPGFDIRCMQHEALYSRLYMS